MYLLRTLELFAEYGDREALKGDGQVFTYSGLRAAVLELAANLRAHGVRPGMTVAVLIGNPVEAPILQLALHLLGTRTAWIAPVTSPREMAGYLRRARPDLLVHDTRDPRLPGAEVLTAVGGLPVLCLGSAGAGPDLLTRTDADPIDLGRLQGEPQSVFQTSGTTGTPKLILHRQSTFEQVHELAELWLADGHPRLRHLSTSPYWLAAGQVAALITLCSGGLVVLSAFDPEQYLATIERERINYAFISPAMLGELLDHPAMERADCASLYWLNVGGAPAAPARLRAAVDRLGPIRVTYGLSESPYVAALPVPVDESDHPERMSSCGLPYGDVRVQIRDEHGAVLEPGRTGAVWVASKLNFAEYLGQPELTGETLVDGWLRTNDLGHLDADGYLYLVDRAQDMIVTARRGWSVYSRPIEDVLAAHPEVSAAAVIGVPDEAVGEVVHAYVVPSPGAAVSRTELIELVRHELNEMWAPRTVQFVDHLPLVGMGKVDKKSLRARYAAEHGGGGHAAAPAGR